MVCAPCRSRLRCGLAVLIRSVHLITVLGVAATLVYYPTALHSALWRGDIVYSAGFLALLVFSLATYFAACLVSPGFVPVKKRIAQRRVWESSDEEEDVDIEEDDVMIKSSETNSGGSPIKLRRCGFCGITQPLRARHCEDCGRCVRKFDHHCPWLATCVGERNHKFFWLFLVSTLVLAIWAVCIVWPCFEFKGSWSTWLYHNGVYFCDLLILASGGFVVGILAGIHTYVMVSGLTTWELMSRERITYLRYLDCDANPFHEGYMLNVINFLCKMRFRKWDGIYGRHVNIPGQEV